VANYIFELTSTYDRLVTPGDLACKIRMLEVACSGCERRGGGSREWDLAAWNVPGRRHGCPGLGQSAARRQSRPERGGGRGRCRREPGSERDALRRKPLLWYFL